MLFDQTRIILDLCGGSGSWSVPYREAGYDVRLVTLPGQDVRFYVPPRNVYGILAAPPCTVFSRAGLRIERSEDELIHALSIVDACFRIVAITHPVFYAVENPATGTLKNLLGEPQFTFDPYEYGDPWTKKTALWGSFAIPERKPVLSYAIDRTTQLHGAKARSITPQGFARAFFEANR